MRYCLKESELNPAIHEIISGPYESEGECLGGCGSSSGSSTEFCESNGVFFPKITITKQPLLEEDATVNQDGNLFSLGCSNDGIVRRSFTVNATFTPEVPANRKVYAWIYSESHDWFTVTPSGTKVIPAGSGGHSWWAGGDTLAIEAECPSNTNILGQLRLDVIVGYLADNGLIYTANEMCELGGTMAGSNQYFVVDCSGLTECVGP